ncbi:MAG TPA: patatin-like phospholipase family protein [Mycobacteriales bacterium]|jgi:NTE family protein|nr:patatin-like phospholipase family protein [Mycobacteriales bacterium]
MSRYGVVLGAGGVLGAAWTIGALRALEQTTGLDPRTAEVLIGTSAGSILSAFLGCGVSTEALANHQAGAPAQGDPAIDYDYHRDGGGGLPPRPKLRMGSRNLLVNATLHPRKVTPMAALAAVLPQGRGSLAAVGSMVDAVAPAGPAAWAPHQRTWLVAMDYTTGKRVPFGREGAPSARLADAVMASCAIPGWYAPVVIGGRRYVDGGACSPTSLDLLAGCGLDTVYVLSPMTSFEYDMPAGVGAKLERHVRRLVTRRLTREAAKVRATGTKVVLLGPGPEDLTAIGANLMDPRRRERVFDTSLRTSAAALGAVDLAAAG